MKLVLWSKLHDRLTSELSCVVAFGLAFMFVFTGFDTQGYIAETALHSISVIEPGRVGPHAGYYGMCITYFAFTLSTFVTPLIVNTLTAKWSMFLASTLYTLFMIAFMLVNNILYYVTSALMGFAAALIWNGHGVYMKEITSIGNESRNSGLQWSINFCSLIFGGFLLLVIFTFTEQSDLLSLSSIRWIFGGLSIFTFLSNIMFALLPNFSERTEEKRESFSVVIGRSLALFKDGKTYLLATCYIYMGLILSFYITIYPSCLSFSKAMVGESNKIIAYYAIITSAAEIIGSSTVSVMSRRFKNFGYMPTAFISLPIHLIAFLGIYLAFPAEANIRPTNGPTYLKPSLFLWLLIGLLIGIGDGLWNTLRTAIITKVYSRNNSPQAFALSKFFQSVATCGSFFCAGMLDLHTQVIILSTVLVASIISFTIAWYIHVLEINSEKRRIVVAIAQEMEPKIH